ncbi:MAG: hypothetical protein R2911_04175 [Caldilineaceae bacterium]
MRFRQLPIPPQATILRAALEFSSSGVDSGATSWLIQAQAIGDAPTFTTASANVSSRARTAAAVTWADVEPWNSQNQLFVSPGLTSVIQELVDRGDWVSGNDIALIITGSGQRRAASYDRSSSRAPRLLLSFVLPPTPTSTFTPTATETITPTLAPTETATFTPTLTFTPTPLVTETATPLFTDTPQSATPPATPTLTALPSETVATNTPTIEATLSPTATMQSTASATPTLPPDATATPIPSETPTGAMGPVFDAIQTYELVDSENAHEIGGEVLPAPGDLLLVRTTVENMGGQSAQNAALYQTFGNYLAFVEDSIVVDKGAGSAALAAAQTRTSQFPLLLGEIAAHSTVTVTFQVQIEPDTPSDVASLTLQGRVEADNALPVLTRGSDEDAASRPTVIRLKPLSAFTERVYLPLLHKQ